MALPAKVSVKISSEEAASVSFSAVVVQEMTCGQLLGHILAVTGKETARVREILERGAVLSGASRIRWMPIAASADDVAEALRAFPDSRPDRPFDPSRCVRAVLTGGRGPVELTRQAASQKGWFQKQTFWDVLLEQAAKLRPLYRHYSYAERADLYHVEFTVESTRAIRDQAGLLRFGPLEQMVREYAYDTLELWVER